MLLSVDWDCYSASVEHTFDSPLWGSPDREADRLDRWRERALRRAPAAQSWSPLERDFPLLGDWAALKRYAGRPAHLAWSHTHARDWLALYPGRPVLNLDSHHDLMSTSGDPARWRPGNWAGLALAQGLMSHYTCRYPDWHAGIRVAEGFDLARTGAELAARLPPEVLARVTLERGPALPDPAEIEAVLLAQSPAWTSPAHDPALLDLAAALGAQPLSPPLDRPW